MKDILNKALAANADTDAVAKVIDTVVNAPRQDAQSDTAIGRSLAVEEALAKRYKALRYAVANIIADAVLGHIAVVSAADDIIKLVTAGRIIDIEDYIWSAKTVHKLDYDADSIANADAKLEHDLGGNDKGAFENGFEPISAANADANYVVNVDAAAKDKDKSDRRVFRKDVNGRIFELRGVNTDAPDELY